MQLKTNLLRSGAVLLLLGAATACDDSPDVFIPDEPIGGDLFDSYVALGNSITAGFQSGGINDSTQRESYAFLLADQVNTRFAYPSLVFPGCPPPIENFVTQARVGGPGAPPCSLRDPVSVTDILNNVAVPGATALDPTSGSTAASNALTTFVLGGLTQVERALLADPTFATVWIGNNDVLPAGVTGLLTPTPGVSPGFTPLATFTANYQAIVDGLETAPRLQGGVLIGVVDVSNAPILFPAIALSIPQFKAGLDQATGQTITVHPNCNGSTSLISLLIVGAIRSRAHPAFIGCEKNSLPGMPGAELVGDIFVLDDAEKATLASVVDEYNTFIALKAAELGFVYYDPNPALAELRLTGCVSVIPNIGSPTNPFGECISLDGIHPRLKAHERVANDLIDLINAEYEIAIPGIP
ncbi:MAG: SGNH/GDSL hydrolase family protein [Gemmatimonadaceae bacterium]